MYCKNCGQEIDDKASICVHCGVAVEQKSEDKGTNVLAIVGFVLSFFIALAGLICSILGYKKAPEFGGKGKSLALAGIIISIISMALVVLIYIIVAAAIGVAMGTV